MLKKFVGAAAAFVLAMQFCTAVSAIELPDDKTAAYGQTGSSGEIYYKASVDCLSECDKTSNGIKSIDGVEFSSGDRFYLSGGKDSIAQLTMYIDVENSGWYDVNLYNGVSMASAMPVIAVNGSINLTTLTETVSDSIYKITVPEVNLDKGTNVITLNLTQQVNGRFDVVGIKPCSSSKTADDGLTWLITSKVLDNGEILMGNTINDTVAVKQRDTDYTVTGEMTVYSDTVAVFPSFANIGHLQVRQNGNYLELKTGNIPSGTYRVVVKKPASNGGRFKIAVDDNVYDTIYDQTVTASDDILTDNISLEEGEHTIRLTAYYGDFRVQSVKLVAVPEEKPAVVSDAQKLNNEEISGDDGCFANAYKFTVTPGTKTVTRVSVDVDGTQPVSKTVNLTGGEYQFGIIVSSENENNISDPQFNISAE